MAAKGLNQRLHMQKKTNAHCAQFNNLTLNVKLFLCSIKHYTKNMYKVVEA
jgi:hypothetical protein